MKNNAALYVRVSTDKQSKGLQAQEHALLEYIKSKSISNYTIFKDENQSGTKASRPALDDMMKRVRTNEFSIVIVYSFSRFARSTKQLLEALNTFNKLNVGFTSISEDISTDTAMGRLVFTFIGALAEFEAELIRERVTNGLRAARAKGIVLGRPRKRPVELIQTLATQGFSTRKIAKLSGCCHTTVVRELKRIGWNYINSG